ncbi:DNA-binding protein [bacterium]|nr:DNA-binding protein [bacterium]
MFPKQNNYNANEKLILTKKIVCECKLFYVDYKENKRGRFLKISEKDSATKRTIIVPAEAIQELSGILQEVAALGSAESEATVEKEQQQE